MQCDVTCPQAGSGCGRCLDRKARKLLELGVQQAKEDKDNTVIEPKGD